MNKTIFQKLIERIKENKFDKIVFIKKGRSVGMSTMMPIPYKMMGMILSKSDWKQYQKAIPKIVLNGYENKIMWFRGYPLKQNND